MSMAEWNMHAESIQNEIAKLKDDIISSREKLKEEHSNEKSRLKEEYDEKYASELDKIKSNSKFVKTTKRR
jgi:hypothetical protein